MKGYLHDFTFEDITFVRGCTIVTNSLNLSRLRDFYWGLKEPFFETGLRLFS